jgi:CheY-like chemotaxis protein
MGKLKRAGRRAALEAATELTKKRKLALHRVDTITAPHILIVDDEPLNCKLLERILVRAAQKQGVASPNVVVAANGLEAVSMVAASLTSPDTIDVERGEGTQSAPFNLICLDRQMPVKDGVEAAREIKALQDGYFTSARSVTQALKPAYVVGMSASIENTAEWLAAGADEMLPKPFTGADIKELLLAMHPSKSASAEASMPGRVSETLHEKELPPSTSLPTPSSYRIPGAVS